jgi:OFA family oxalate/formate antiporter-like MFS transporter
MWTLFFCNIAAGIIFIGFQSPMLQDLLKQVRPGMATADLAGAGALLIAATSLCNGIGRFLWGGVSDKVGRVQAFRMILGSQVLVFAVLPFVSAPLVFAALVCYVLLCYGGGFGTMPSFVLDVFGAKRMPVVYGSMLTAWSAAGIVGPQLAGYIKDRHADHAFAYTFAVGGVFLSVGLVVAFFTRNTRAAS